ncbi:uncharacterized protein EV422DRAFT_563835 [Fimicolochytrium jonesii]|uniref:uncharacterized protein n=1 Tax=Fimicolochytrium jonesii TaxID=1396493 RepID=UPI0022FEFBAC|nr:uncharacterized protein EV422DRAFT_563835 [Fimicolochytrium jonesii]KAI8826021.1 hypothetical protein EV422DRAFT_563835 [Fimicolochytrium jonesii]
MGGAPNYTIDEVIARLVALGIAQLPAAAVQQLETPESSDIPESTNPSSEQVQAPVDAAGLPLDTLQIGNFTFPCPAKWSRQEGLGQDPVDLQERTDSNHQLESSPPYLEKPLTSCRIHFLPIQSFPLTWLSISPALQRYPSTTTPSELLDHITCAAHRRWVELTRDVLHIRSGRNAVAASEEDPTLRRAGFTIVLRDGPKGLYRGYCLVQKLGSNPAGQPTGNLADDAVPTLLIVYDCTDLVEFATGLDAFLDVIRKCKASNASNDSESAPVIKSPSPPPVEIPIDWRQALADALKVDLDGVQLWIKKITGYQSGQQAQPQAASSQSAVPMGPFTFPMPSNWGLASGPQPPSTAADAQQGNPSISQLTVISPLSPVHPACAIFFPPFTLPAGHPLLQATSAPTTLTSDEVIPTLEVVAKTAHAAGSLTLANPPITTRFSECIVQHYVLQQSGAQRRATWEFRIYAAVVHLGALYVTLFSTSGMTGYATHKDTFHDMVRDGFGSLDDDKPDHAHHDTSANPEPKDAKESHGPTPGQPRQGHKRTTRPKFATSHRPMTLEGLYLGSGMGSLRLDPVTDKMHNPYLVITLLLTHAAKAYVNYVPTKGRLSYFPHNDDEQEKQGQKRAGSVNGSTSSLLSLSTDASIEVPDAIPSQTQAPKESDPPALPPRPPAEEPTPIGTYTMEDDGDRIVITLPPTTTTPTSTLISGKVTDDYTLTFPTTAFQTFSSLTLTSVLPLPNPPPAPPTSSGQNGKMQKRKSVSGIAASNAAVLTASKYTTEEGGALVFQRHLVPLGGPEIAGGAETRDWSLTYDHPVLGKATDVRFAMDHYSIILHPVAGAVVEPTTPVTPGDQPAVSSTESGTTTAKPHSVFRHSSSTSGARKPQWTVYVPREECERHLQQQKMYRDSLGKQHAKNAKHAGSTASAAGHAENSGNGNRSRSASDTALPLCEWPPEVLFVEGIRFVRDHDA